jgi:hypothetical protein
MPIPSFFPSFDLPHKNVTLLRCVKDFRSYEPLRVDRLNYIAVESKRTFRSSRPRYLLHAGFLLGLFYSADGGDMLLPKRLLTFSELHATISEEMNLSVE